MQIETTVGRVVLKEGQWMQVDASTGEETVLKEGFYVGYEVVFGSADGEAKLVPYTFRLMLQSADGQDLDKPVLQRLKYVQMGKSARPIFEQASVLQSASGVFWAPVQSSSVVDKQAWIDSDKSRIGGQEAVSEARRETLIKPYIAAKNFETGLQKNWMQFADEMAKVNKGPASSHQGDNSHQAVASESDTGEKPLKSEYLHALVSHIAPYFESIYRACPTAASFHAALGAFLNSDMGPVEAALKDEPDAEDVLMKIQGEVIVVRSDLLLAHAQLVKNLMRYREFATSAKEALPRLSDILLLIRQATVNFLGLSEAAIPINALDIPEQAIIRMDQLVDPESLENHATGLDGADEVRASRLAQSFMLTRHPPTVGEWIEMLTFARDVIAGDASDLYQQVYAIIYAQLEGSAFSADSFYARLTDLDQLSAGQDLNVGGTLAEGLRIVDKIARHGDLFKLSMKLSGGLGLAFMRYSDVNGRLEAYLYSPDPEEYLFLFHNVLGHLQFQDDEEGVAMVSRTLQLMQLYRSRVGQDELHQVDDSVSGHVGRMHDLLQQYQSIGENLGQLSRENLKQATKIAKGFYGSSVSAETHEDVLALASSLAQDNADSKQVYACVQMLLVMHEPEKLEAFKQLVETIGVTYEQLMRNPASAVKKFPDAVVFVKGTDGETSTEILDQIVQALEAVPKMGIPDQIQSLFEALTAEQLKLLSVRIDFKDALAPLMSQQNVDDIQHMLLPIRTGDEDEKQYAEMICDLITPGMLIKWLSHSLYGWPNDRVNIMLKITNKLPPDHLDRLLSDSDVRAYLAKEVLSQNSAFSYCMRMIVLTSWQQVWVDHLRQGAFPKLSLFDAVGYKDTGLLYPEIDTSDSHVAEKKLQSYFMEVAGEPDGSNRWHALLTIIKTNASRYCGMMVAAIEALPRSDSDGALHLQDQQPEVIKALGSAIKDRSELGTCLRLIAPHDGSGKIKRALYCAMAQQQVAAKTQDSKFCRHIILAMHALGHSTFIGEFCQSLQLITFIHIFDAEHDALKNVIDLSEDPYKSWLEAEKVTFSDIYDKLDKSSFMGRRFQGYPHVLTILWQKAASLDDICKVLKIASYSTISTVPLGADQQSKIESHIKTRKDLCQLLKGAGYRLGLAEKAILSSDKIKPLFEAPIACLSDFWEAVSILDRVQYAARFDSEHKEELQSRVAGYRSFINNQIQGSAFDKERVDIEAYLHLRGQKDLKKISGTRHGEAIDVYFIIQDGQVTPKLVVTRGQSVNSDTQACHDVMRAVVKSCYRSHAKRTFRGLHSIFGWWGTPDLNAVWQKLGQRASKNPDGASSKTRKALMNDAALAIKLLECNLQKPNNDTHSDLYS